MSRISKEDLSEEELEAVISSRGFQKMMLYQRLADGIEVLQTQDRLYKSMVRVITEQHSEIDSVGSIEEVLSLLEQEIKTYTEPLDDDKHNKSDFPGAVSVLDAGTNFNDSARDTDPGEVVREYLAEKLEDCDKIEIKAKEIASDIGFRSTHVGGILGRWRNGENPPFAITASESASSGNVWTIKPQ